MEPRVRHICMDFGRGLGETLYLFHTREAAEANGRLILSPARTPCQPHYDGKPLPGWVLVTRMPDRILAWDEQGPILSCVHSRLTFPDEGA